MLKFFQEDLEEHLVGIIAFQDGPEAAAKEIVERLKWIQDAGGLKITMVKNWTED